MKTINNIDYQNWQNLDWEERLDITINTMFIKDLINKPQVFEFNDVQHGVIELQHVEEDEKLALTEGWICLRQSAGPEIELNLFRESGCPIFADYEEIWGAVYSYLETLRD